MNSCEYTLLTLATCKMKWISTVITMSLNIITIFLNFLVEIFYDTLGYDVLDSNVYLYEKE